MNSSAIATIKLPDEYQSSSLSNECAIAMQDLTVSCDFSLVGNDLPPYNIDMKIQDNKLVLDICNTDIKKRHSFILSMSPYRRIIRDYFMMVDSYQQMRDSVTPEKLQTVDMARRGIHNEGADILMARLQDKITMDHDTARRFFTLLCCLGARRGDGI